MPKVIDRLLMYHSGEPTFNGTYACRIPIDVKGIHFCDDQFLQWFDNQWYYPSSDSRYRGEVIGWLGPLQRLNREKDNA